MARPLVILFPLLEAAREIREDIEAVLRTLSDWTLPFAVLLADNASRDETFDAAAAMAQRHCQVIAWRSHHRLGLTQLLDASLRANCTALAARVSLANADILAHDGLGPRDADRALAALWSETARAALDRSESPPSGNFARWKGRFARRLTRIDRATRGSWQGSFFRMRFPAELRLWPGSSPQLARAARAGLACPFGREK